MRRGVTAVLTTMLSAGALAQSSLADAGARAHRDRTYVGQDIFVGEGQEIGNATCFFCSVQVEGEVAGRVLVVFGNLNVAGRVKRGVTVVGGNAVVDGPARVEGDTTVVDGNAVYETDEALAGSATVLGGHIATIAGQKSGRRRTAMSPLAIWTLLLLGFVALVGGVVAAVRRREPRMVAVR